MKEQAGTQTATGHFWLPMDRLSLGWAVWWAVGKKGGKAMHALTPPAAGTAVC